MSDSATGDDIRRRIDAERFVQMVRVRIEHREPGRDPIEAAGWFLAWHEADVVSQMSRRELARAIYDGGTLGGPYRTIDDIATGIKTWALEEGKPLTAGDWKIVAKQLDEFFQPDAESRWQTLRGDR